MRWRPSCPARADLCFTMWPFRLALWINRQVTFPLICLITRTSFPTVFIAMSLLVFELSHKRAILRTLAEQIFSGRNFVPGRRARGMRQRN